MSVLLNQSNITNPLLNGTTYILTENVTVTAPLTFSGSGTGVIFDGSGYVITVVNQSAWTGLVGVQPITVQNLGVDTSGSTLYNDLVNFGDDAPGWIFNAYSTGSASRCYSIGPIVQYGGGIFGAHSSGPATNCYSVGAVGFGAGGIFGNRSTGSATSCFSVGSIGTNAGGIFGTVAVSGTATNCYSTGDMASGAGGIFAIQAQTSTATNCHSSGIIGEPSSGNAGGIFGYNSFSPSVINCYTSGVINPNSDSLVGFSFNPGTPTVTNSGHTVGWDNASANTYLTGYPGTGSPIWAILVAGRPYILITNPPPNNPIIGTAVAGIDSAIVNWTRGTVLLSPVYQYRVTATPGGGVTIVNAPDLSANVTGLTAGTPYTFSVVATDALANQSSPSAASNSVIPFSLTTTTLPPTTTTTLPPTTTTTLPPTTTTTLPPTTTTLPPTTTTTLPPTTTTTTTMAPSQFTVTGMAVPTELGSVRVEWTRNPDAFLYITTCSQSQSEISTVITTVTYRDLVPGSTHVFTVYAFNQAGTILAIGYSSPFTLPTLPGLMGSFSASAGIASAIVSWTVPTNGGVPLTGYTLTLRYDGFLIPVSPVVSLTAAAGTTLTVTIPGLQSGIYYTVTGVAANSFGQGPVTNRVGVIPV